MKKLMFSAVMIIAFMFSAAACSSNNVEIGAEANGTTIDLETGQKLVISLESNPTTGFDWEVSEIDDAVITKSGDSEFTAESDLIGAGGMRTFTFKAAGTGTCTLKLIYHRAWETGIAPEQEFSVTINVK